VLVRECRVLVQGCGVLYDVSNAAIVIVDDVDHTSTAECAGVERLASGRGIERGPIEEDDGSAVSFDRAVDRSFKASYVRIRVIQTFGHR